MEGWKTILDKLYKTLVSKGLTRMFFLAEAMLQTLVSEEACGHEVRHLALYCKSFLPQLLHLVANSLFWDWLFNPVNLVLNYICGVWMGLASSIPSIWGFFLDPETFEPVINLSNGWNGALNNAKISWLFHLPTVNSMIQIFWGSGLKDRPSGPSRKNGWAISFLKNFQVAPAPAHAHFCTDQRSL